MGRGQLAFIKLFRTQCSVFLVLNFSVQNHTHTGVRYWYCIQYTQYKVKTAKCVFEFRTFLSVDIGGSERRLPITTTKQRYINLLIVLIYYELHIIFFIHKNKNPSHVDSIQEARVDLAQC